MKNLNLQKFAAWYVTKGCVKILWDDNNNELGLRPDSLDVTYSFYDGDTKESTHTITVSEADTIEPELDFNGSRMYPQNWYFQESNSWAKIDGYLDGGTYYTITVDSYPQEIEGYELNEYDYGISNVDFMDGDAIRYCCITIVYKLKKSQGANRKRVHFNNETQPQIYFGHNPIKKIIYDGKTVWIDENLVGISYKNLATYTNFELSNSTHQQLAEGAINKLTTNEELYSYGLYELEAYSHEDLSYYGEVEETEYVSVTSVTITPSNEYPVPSEEVQWTATILPENATDQNVIWSCTGDGSITEDGIMTLTSGRRDGFVTAYATVDGITSEGYQLYFGK